MARRLGFWATPELTWIKIHHSHLTLYHYETGTSTLQMQGRDPMTREASWNARSPLGRAEWRRRFG